MLTQSITKEFVSHQLDGLSPDRLAEVAQFIEFLQFQGTPTISANLSGEHVAFGIWADYPEANDPAAFALNLRQTNGRQSQPYVEIGDPK